ncbi:unnamed protein product [Spirodela intermedia]|uniref:mannan endo-1,4-beta-mannosidase n=1 Tax=Spirodela intermedia TaxID=51605 RepID=A0A7I8JMY4_SPIIN|nr:unnamed protein product [Spirodela intermedia]CAA6670822.1 unnamed protein product [Spirodela intermedia]
MGNGRSSYPLIGVLLLAVVGYFNWSGGGVDPSRLRIPIPWLQPPMSFVGRNGTRFVLLRAEGGGSGGGGEAPSVYVNGWNSYWLMAAAASQGRRGRETVAEMLRRGRDMGMEVCRTWAFSDGGRGGGAALQISPGRFDEQVFQALDYVIYEARRNQVRLILCLVNNLEAFGGKAQYVRWAQEAGVNLTSSDDPFFSILRRNSYSGVLYSDEPAIFAWELMNEPRCSSNSSAPLLQAWIAEMAAHIKSIDQKHLVTVGLEGFYGSKRAERLGVNPGDWAGSLGSDFIQNSAVQNIDFASAHAYPDSWIPNAGLEEKVEYLASWVDYHVNDGERILKKPVLITEIGSYLKVNEQGLYERDVLLKTAYDKVYKSAEKGQAGAGALIWQLILEGIEEQYGDKFSLVAEKYPSTDKLIRQQSCRLRYLLRRNQTDDKPGWPC